MEYPKLFIPFYNYNSYNTNQGPLIYIILKVKALTN